MSEHTSSTSAGSPVSQEHAADPAEHAGGQGRGRGRGYGGRGGPRGRPGWGRGRGGPGVNAASEPIPPRTAYAEQAPRPRLTHFISIPLGHNAALRDTVSAFTNALLAATPAIPGLDASIVVPARRLHLTLGVMSLDPEEDPAGAGPKTSPRSLEAAKTLLREVRPRIMELLGEEALRVSLDCLDIMRPENGDRARAHVMWVGPAAGGASLKKLEEVAELVQTAFKAAGLLVDEDRPFKTHCTVLNTVYRKPALRWRFPFSYQSVLASEAMKAIRVDRKDAVNPSQLDQGMRRVPVSVGLGECPVDEIQICEMGSWGPEGEYVAVARESLSRA